MPECRGSGADARRPFIVVAYAANAGGRLVASLPSSCPWHVASDGACRVWMDHLRERKTGPCFALAVVRCGLHGKAFTLYPPGHVPYGRVAVAPVSAEGALVHDAPLPEHEVATTQDRSDRPLDRSDPPLGWSTTVFAAAVDAAAGRAWPRKHPALPAHWRTQGRRLVRGARLIGIAPRQAGDPERHRERMGRGLGVPMLSVVAGARSWSDARGYRDRGVAIVAIIDEVERARTVTDRLLSAGTTAELWGPPSRWDAGARALRRVPFS